jgi:2-dehydropantoate 2-reductase
MPVTSIGDALSAAGAAFDLAILTVKSYDTAGAIAEILRSAPPDRLPPVLSLQNGVGNEESLAAALGNAAVIAGTLTTPVTTVGPGAVRVERPSYNLGLSPWVPNGVGGVVDSAETALRRAGFDVVRYASAPGMKWTKLLMNMLGNATSAILDMPPEEVFLDTMLVDLEIDAWREALAVMRAAGIAPVNLGSYPFAKLAPLIRSLPKRALRSILRKRIGSARGGKMPSLSLDLHGGRKESEVPWLNGAVVRSGAEVGVPTPVNAMLTQTLLSLACDPVRQEQWRHNGARLAAAAAEAKSRRMTDARVSD